jgi:hypothetical protein
MIEVLKGLEGALAEEIRLQRELAGTGSRKRDALVRLDVVAVDQATSREQSLLGALGPAAERRLRRTLEVCRLLGIPEAEASVTRVADRVGEPWRAALLTHASDLRGALAEVARVNRSNRALTEQSLDYVKRFFRILGGGGDETNYTRRGLESRGDAPRLMIDEVV